MRYDICVAFFPGLILFGLIWLFLVRPRLAAWMSRLPSDALGRGSMAWLATSIFLLVFGYSAPIAFFQLVGLAASWAFIACIVESIRRNMPTDGSLIRQSELEALRNRISGQTELLDRQRRRSAENVSQTEDNPYDEGSDEDETPETDEARISASQDGDFFTAPGVRVQLPKFRDPPAEPPPVNLARQLDPVQVFAAATRAEAAETDMQELDADEDSADVETFEAEDADTVSAVEAAEVFSQPQAGAQPFGLTGKQSEPQPVSELRSIFATRDVSQPMAVSSPKAVSALRPVSESGPVSALAAAPPARPLGPSAPLFQPPAGAPATPVASAPDKFESADETPTPGPSAESAPADSDTGGGFRYQPRLVESRLGGAPLGKTGVNLQPESRFGPQSPQNREPEA